MTPCSIDGCEKKSYKRGWCSMHYSRWWRSGDVGESTERQRGGRTAGTWRRAPIATRYEVRPDGCWLWLGSKDEKGYGNYRTDGKTRSAHRYMYELHVGPIPEGLEIDHLCRNPSCVNPEHLEPVTRRENLARSANPARFGILFNTCMRGHEFTPENTYWSRPRPSRAPGRTCRTCMRAAARRRYLRKKEAAAPFASDDAA